MTTGLTPRDSSIAAHWWVPLVRGIVSIAFGVVLYVYPISAIGVFVIFFGAFALVDGILAILQAVRYAHPRSSRWWLHIASGVAGILIGILTFAWPAITAYTLALFIAAWAFVTGIFEISAGIALRHDVKGEIFMILAGACSLLLGIVLFFIPLVALLAWVWLIAAYAIIAGISLVALAFRLRRHQPAGR